MSWDRATLIWYWKVDNSSPGTQVWQGSGGQFVPFANADYVAFLAAGNFPTEIDTFANLMIVIDNYNQRVTSPPYLAVSSGVNYQMANTPPLMFDFSPSAGGLTVTLPQMNVPEALAKNRPLTVRNNTQFPFLLKTFDSLHQFSVQAAGTTYGSSIQTFYLTDNTTTGGTILPAPTVQAESTIGNTDASLVFSNSLITTYVTGATLTAPRTWTLPQAILAGPGDFLLVEDAAGGVSATNTLTAQVFAGDTINGAALNVVLNRPHGWVLLQNTAGSSWSIVGGKGALDFSDITTGIVPTSQGGTGVNYLPLQGFIGGLTLSTAGASSTMSIAAGMCCSDDFTTMMKLAAFSKTTAAWAAGSGNGGLDTGAAANNTWYHWFIIERTDTGVVDALFSLSATAPTLPTNYTKQRRIGSGKTDGSGNWTKFIQDGDVFRWDTPVLDVNGVTNPGTAAVLRTLTVPLGVNVYADIAVVGEDDAGGNSPGAIYISDPAVADTAPGGAVMTAFAFMAAAATAYLVGNVAQVRTNTSAQVRSRLQFSDANTKLYIGTLGWTDRRGAR